MKSRPPELIERAAHAWVEKKFKSKSKHAARNAAWPGLEWRFVLIHAVVKSQAELAAISGCDVKTIPLHRVLQELAMTDTAQIRGGAGTDLSEVIEYFYKHANNSGLAPSLARNHIP